MPTTTPAPAFRFLPNTEARKTHGKYCYEIYHFDGLGEALVAEHVRAEDVELLVTACNAHDALVAALEWALANIEPHHRADATCEYSRYRSACDALAQARGEGV